jgi:predicted RNA-binding Zn ribbon-like protein
MDAIRDIPFVAGNVGLDFVNTAEERGHPEADDALRTPADLRLWGQRYGLIAKSLRLADHAQTELERAHDARELLYALLFARVHQQPARQDQLARLAELTTAAYQAAILRVDKDGSVRWHWSPSELATIRHVALTSGLQLLHDPSPRLKQCPGDHCGWFFLDRTKRGNRRWCRMGECGQEAKTERRRQRRHSGTPARSQSSSTQS